MDHGRQMSVVIFEDIGADCIQKRGMQRVGPLAPAKHTSLRRPEIGHQHPGREPHGLVLRAAERAPDEIQDRPHTLSAHRLRDVVPARAGDECRQPVGHRVCAVHGASPRDRQTIQFIAFLIAFRCGLITSV
jgi:hypothetical protein